MSFIDDFEARLDGQPVSTSDRDAFEAAIDAQPGDHLPRLVYADYLDERGLRHTALRQRLTVTFHAILEEPADDAPRLKHAEVLEQYGNSERAEFIRVQYQLAHANDRTHWPDAKWRWWNSWTSPTIDALRRRERVLGSNSCNVRGLPCAIERGFLSKVTCRVNDWMQHGQWLVQYQPIERVDLIDESTVIRDRNPTILRITKPGHWRLSVHSFDALDTLPAVSAEFDSRADLIGGMPFILRNWGIYQP